MPATANGSDGNAAITNGGNSPYALLPSDRKAISVARASASASESRMAKAKADFAGKGAFGLWCDGKGLFCSSNVAAVTGGMEKIRKLHAGVKEFTEMVEKGDEKSFDYLLSLYEELSELEKDAQWDVKNSKSYAMCRELRRFLDDKYKLDHNLKKVECVVLKQKIGRVEQTCEKATRAVTEVKRDMVKLLEENKKIQDGVQEAIKASNDRAEELQGENQMCKSMLVSLSREKEELKEALGKKMEDLSLEADRRCEAIREESDRKLKAVIEEADRRAEERFHQMLEAMRNVRFP